MLVWEGHIRSPRERWFVLKIPQGHQTKIQNREMVLEHGGAPLAEASLPMFRNGKKQKERPKEVNLNVR